jgi:surface carbohydrate biosynthesis protein
MSRNILYLPVEIKQREYDSQIALATEAARKGYKVFLGTHAAIFTLIRNNKQEIGIYLDKGMPSPERLKWLREKCSHIWVMDAEVSPIHTSEVLVKELPSRLYSEGTLGIDKYLVVGELAYKATSIFFGSESSKVLKSGWPRIDLAGPLGQRIYAEETVQLKEKYPSFFLFASSFGGNKNPKDVINQKRATLHEMTPFWTESFAKLRYQKFLHAVECLKAWDANPRVPTIIVRPHVAESIQIWREKLGKLNKTFIEESGNASSWIYASEGVIHQGSTLALQSFIGGKVNYFLKDASFENYSTIAEKVSSQIVSLGEPPVRAGKETAKSNPEYDPGVIDSAIYMPPEGAISRIISEMDLIPANFDTSKITFSPIISQFSMRSIRRVVGLLRDEVYWKLGLMNLHPQSRSIPGGLGKKEIKRVLSAMQSSNSIVIKRRTINLWEIRAL